jgi:hypothetical protein
MRRIGVLLLIGLMSLWTVDGALAQPGNITLVSTSDSGVKGNGGSGGPSLSADGTKAVFSSWATNLDPADTDTINDVYVKDLVSGDIMLASTSDSGIKGNGSNYWLSISADGTAVAFVSFATNLDPVDTDAVLDVYVKNITTGDLTLASTSDSGVKASGESNYAMLSADGDRVSFLSRATNLDPADTDTRPDIYVKDITTGDLMLASTSDSGVKGNDESWFPSPSADGSKVAFISLAENLDPGDTDAKFDTFVKDLPSGDIMLASTSDSGEKGNHHSSFFRRPSLSSDGASVAFESFASNLDPDDHDHLADIYVKDLPTGGITLASTSDSGMKGENGSYAPFMSSDRGRVAFYSYATNLDPADVDRIPDVYVKDLVSGDITLASTSDSGVKGSGDSYTPVLSAYGTSVAFYSYATNLDPADGDSLEDVYVKVLEGVADTVTARGHAHTDYSSNGKHGPGTVHIAPNVMGGESSRGQVRYSDLREDPPGGPLAAFRCRGTPTAVTGLGPQHVLIEGTVRCPTLKNAAVFSLVLIDQGRNPPNQDSYHMTIYDDVGGALYDWTDATTVGLGDLLVKAV